MSAAFEGEKWENVRGFGNKYQISEMGAVRNGWGKILCIQRNAKGQPAVMLGWDKKTAMIPVEKLMRRAFPIETVITHG